MWAKRADQLRDVVIAVDLDPVRCLDTADFIARNGRRYGIEADLTFRRNRSGHAYDRHFVICRRPGGTRAEGLGPTGTLVWAMYLDLTAHEPEETEVVLGLRTYRRSGRRSAADRAAFQYQELLASALVLLHEQKQQRRGPRPNVEHDNVIQLRPYVEMPSLGSA